MDRSHNQCQRTLDIGYIWYLVPIPPARTAPSNAGSASNDFRWVTAGVLLLVVSVLCAWDALWCLDMNLATFAALFHGPSVVFSSFKSTAKIRHDLLIRKG